MLTLPSPSFIDAVSFKRQLVQHCTGHFLSGVTSQTLLVARSHTHMGPHICQVVTNTPIQSSSFIPLIFYPCRFLSHQLFLFVCLMEMTRGGFTLLRILTIQMFSLSLSCLTSSTAPCQPTTAWRPCRSTATSARSSSTNATSEWLAVCPPCCRETPTRHIFSLLVQVRESQALHGELVSCPCHSSWTLNMLVMWCFSEGQTKWVSNMAATLM